MKKVVLTLWASLLLLALSGCVNSVKEGLSAMGEVPTVEAQANRVAVGMGVLRINHIIANDMPISADAKWPALMSKDISRDQYLVIDKAIETDPYFGTHQYSDPVQLSQLGGYFIPKVSPLTYIALQKFAILYGDDVNNWPNIFRYSTQMDTFLEFENADQHKPIYVEATTSDAFPNLFSAMISLMPVNYQKDLETSRDEMQEAFDKVAELKREREELKNILETDKAARSPNYEGEWQPLSSDEKLEVQRQIAVLDEQIISSESEADDKQAINYQIIDSALEQLKGEINLSDQNVRLAQNIKLAIQEIKHGAGEATVMFTLATTNIAARKVYENFPTELATLTASIAIMPPHKRDLMGERIDRLKNNIIYLLPSIGMGSYYATKQFRLANKYEDVVDVIIEADKSRKAKLKRSA